jgi:hypothetical protein
MSIEAITATLAEVCQCIQDAQRDVLAARANLEVATRILTELERNHPDELVPGGFPLADQLLVDSLTDLSTGLEAIQRFQSTL